LQAMKLTERRGAPKAVSETPECHEENSESHKKKKKETQEGLSADLQDRGAPQKRQVLKEHKEENKTQAPFDNLKRQK